MTKLLIGSTLAALALAMPAAAQAQRLSPTVVAVVDSDRILRECNACRTAQQSLQTQVQQLQQRQQQLGAPLQTEAQSIRTAVEALKGKQPDAALQGRITALQQKQNTANQELQRSEQNIRSIQLHVAQQINQRLQPIVNQVMSNRGAALVVDRSAALAVSPSIDITNDVLAQLNQQLPSVSLTPMPQQQQQQQPQSR